MANIEKKDDNLDSKSFRDKLRSLRDSILGKKDSVEDISRDVSKKTEMLKGSVIDTALGNLEVNVNKQIESDEATRETKTQLDEIMKESTKKEVGHQSTSYNIDKRSKSVSEGILESVQNVEDDYRNWESEQDPFARNLLRFTDWIMKSEK